MEETVVDMHGIFKSFDGVPVLTDVGLQVKKGEIHALLGENGAGKSTLMRVLAAETPMDGGEIVIGGKRAALAGPTDAKSCGIAFVHQELAVIPTLSVAENLYLGHLPLKKGLVDWQKLKKASEQLLKQLDVDFSSDRLVGDLSMGQKQIVEIAKAIAMDAQIFIMDEPTASLSSDESSRLFELMRLLARKGKSFIYISHRLQEVLAIADRITVLRDGRTIATVDAKGVTPNRLGELIIGKKVEENVQAGTAVQQKDAPVRLEVEGMKTDKVEGVDLKVYAGEIVVLYGLIGAGRTELARAIMGVDRRQEGTVRINGKEVPGKIGSLIKSGVGFLPEDRKNQALFLNLPVFHNITVTKYRKITRNGLLNRKLEREAVRKYIRELKIKAGGADRLNTLSGGTQQKVGLSKWLYADSRVLILDEPTKGIDISARFEIYKTLYALAEQGVGILVISSDLEEVIRIAHRILVMRSGKIVGEFESKNLSEEVLLAYALGTNSAA